MHYNDFTFYRLSFEKKEGFTWSTFKCAKLPHHILEFTRLHFYCRVVSVSSMGLKMPAAQYDNSQEVQDIRRSHPRAPCKVSMTLPLAVIRSVPSLCIWKCDLQLRPIMSTIILNHCHKVNQSQQKTHALFAVYSSLPCAVCRCMVKRCTDCKGNAVFRKSPSAMNYFIPKPLLWGKLGLQKQGAVYHYKMQIFEGKHCFPIM